MPRDYTRSPEPPSSASKRSKHSHPSASSSSRRDRDRSPSPGGYNSKSRDDYRDRDRRRDSSGRDHYHRDREWDDRRDYRASRDSREDRGRDDHRDRRSSHYDDRERPRSSSTRELSPRPSSSRTPPPPSHLPSTPLPPGLPRNPMTAAASSPYAPLSSHSSVSGHHHPSLPPLPPTTLSPAAAGYPLPGTSSSSSPSVSAEEAAKLQAKREKLAAWKAQQAAKKAASPSPAPSSPAPAAASPSSSSSVVAAVASSTTDKPSFGTGGSAKISLGGGSLSRIGLPLKPSTLSRSTMALDDGPAPARKLEKLGKLPEIDKTVAVELGEDDDQEELEYEFKASVKDGERGESAAATSGSNAMDVDGTDLTTAAARAARADRSNGAAAAAAAAVASAPASAPAADAMDEDEEEDPLDAYMKGVTQERAKVDLEDYSRMQGGKGEAKARPRAFGLDEDEGEEEKEDLEPKKGEEPITAEEILAMAAKRNRRKELAAVDHSKTQYEPFRKAFYTPPQEVLDMTEEDVELLRLEMDGIKIRGVDCPRPVKRWGAFGLPGGCLEVIKRLGYEAPTSIQAQAIPAIMSGRDVIGVAKTGSGKTIAFLLPLLRHLKDQRPLESGEGPIAVIMTPTRELALQIVREVKPFAKVLNLTAMCAYGGQPISEQIAEMKKGADLVVCTPGRMIDLLTANSGRVTNLKRVTYLVLDEADRMFDMGFEPQVMKIINNVRPDRQVVLFSATFPKQMDGLARKVLVKPLEVTVGGRSVVAKEIEQKVEVRAEETKFNRLLELLGETYETEEDLNEKRTLIFVERQEAADDLLLKLNQKSYRRANTLHGGKEQVDRDQTLANFKSGLIPIVIATSVAARGLDVKQLILVINYDVPNHMEDYVHRAGRTGRAGNKGTCVTFITPEQEKYSVDICRAVEASLAARNPPITPLPEHFAELKAMSDGFLAKVRSGAAKSHSGTGFGGKGLDRLDTDRESKEQAERSHFGEDKDDKKKDDDKDGADGKDKDGSGEFQLPGFNVDIVKGPAPERVGMSGGSRGGAAARTAVAPAQQHRPITLKAQGPNQEGVNKVQAALDKINAELARTKAAKSAAAGAERGGPAPASDAQATGGASSSVSGGISRNVAPSDGRKPKDPDATDYHAFVQINDFVQKARWMVTNRESMTKLIDMTGAAITNRGIYYEPGKEPPPGAEGKLSLLIESNDEWRVETAVREIKRLLIEGTIAGLAHAERTGQQMTTGRYKVE